MESSANSPSSLYSDEDRFATKDSKTREYVSPLLKKELRLAISTKRMKSQSTPTDTTPKLEPVQYQLTEDETRRKERRREQNRRAAERCREKKKETQSLKEKEKDSLLRSNKELMNRISEMKRQLMELKNVYDNHMNSGLCFQKHNNSSIQQVAHTSENSIEDVSNNSFDIPTVVGEELRSRDENGACFSANCTESFDRNPTTFASGEYSTVSCSVSTEYAAVALPVDKDVASDHGSITFPNDCSLEMNSTDTRVPNMDLLDLNGNMVLDIIDDLCDVSPNYQQSVENPYTDFPVSNSYQTLTDSQYETYETSVPSMYCDNDNLYGVDPLAKDTIHMNGMSSENNNIPNLPDGVLEEVNSNAVSDQQLFSLMREFDM